MSRLKGLDILTLDVRLFKEDEPQLAEHPA
jgi:hypothetical protein